MARGGMVSARGAGARWRVASVLMLLLALLMTSAGIPSPALAQTLTVTNGDDGGAGSLREAIAEADADDTIDFAVGVTTVTLTSDQLIINKNLTIEGSGVGGVTIRRSSAEGTPDFRIFLVFIGVSVTLQGLTISNGSAGDDTAGGISNGGTLSLIDSVVSGNSSVQGGGIHNRGPLTMTNSIVSDNTSTGIGGGIFTSNATAIVTNITVSGNNAVQGGGMYVSGGTVTVTGSTISGNTALTGYGGGLLLDGTVTVTNSTISGNTALTGAGITVFGFSTTLRAVTVTANEALDEPGGGGLHLNGSTATLFGSIVAGNTAPAAADCSVSFATLTSDGYNVVGSGGGCPSDGTADATHTGALGTLLNPTLADNGGTTLTHALVAGSAALNRVPTGECALIDLDQRGIDRPAGAGCDSGAFEARSFTLTTSDSGPGTVAPATGDYIEGTVVAVTATPDSGASFLGWTLDGNPAGSASPLNVTMDDDHTVVGTFGYLLTVTTSGTGTVARNPPGTGSGPFGYAPGSAVTLTPQPGAGQTFVGWTVDGVVAGWANPLTSTMDAAHSVVATFAPTKSFADVLSDRADFAAITALASRGTIRGYNLDPPAFYGPDDGVLRAQMAVLIARAMPNGPGLPPRPLTPPACTVAGSWDCEDWGNTFTDQGDLDPNLWRAAGTMQHYGAAKGYTAQDCLDKNKVFPCYGPNDPVSHAQTIAFITRAMWAKGYWLEEPVVLPPAPAGVPEVLVPEVRAFLFYVGAIPAAPMTEAGWNGQATRGWFAQVLWATLNSYWGSDATLPDGLPAGGFVP